MEPSLAALVAVNPVLRAFSPLELDRALEAGAARSYPKDHLISLAGDIWPYLFLALDGRVSALKESREGRSLLISTFEPGDMFWGLAFFLEDAPMPVSLQAREDCRVFLWERTRLLPLLTSNGRAAWELSGLLVNQMLRASNIVEGLAFQPVAGRVARFLLEQTAPNQAAAPRRLTLDEMAAHIGTTREMVCRYLHSFSDEGLIEISRTEYTITDRRGLKALTRQEKG